MSRLGIRWVILYFLSILVPAALLAFLSVRSLRDVHDSVRRELRSKAVLVQDAFDRLINSRAQLLAAYSEDGAMDPRLYAGFSEIAQIFAVDPTGVLRHPAVQPLRLQEPRAAFAAQMEKAEKREFGHQDWAGGVQIYRQAWKEAASPEEEAEALNALARCAHKGKDLAMVEGMHQTLAALYGQVFDADGGHPVTLSHLRLGRYAVPEQAQASLMAWTEALLEGRYPLYAGCQQALQDARALAQGRLADLEDRPVLLERLALIEGTLDFALRFGPVVEDQWTTAQEQGYISGVGGDGTSFLMYLGAAEGGGAVGILFDWVALTALVQEQVEGLAERDFSLALFDADAEAAFLAAHREAIYETGPASRWMDRMRLGDLGGRYFCSHRVLPHAQLSGGRRHFRLGRIRGFRWAYDSARRWTRGAGSPPALRVCRQCIARVAHPAHVHPHVRRDPALGPLPIERTDAGLSDDPPAREPTPVALGG